MSQPDSWKSTILLLHLTPTISHECVDNLCGWRLSSAAAKAASHTIDWAPFHQILSLRGQGQEEGAGQSL